MECPEPARSVEESISPLVASYVYAGLATYRAYNGRKEDAINALKQAHRSFQESSEEEQIPLWIDHNIGNLLINDAEVHMHLGDYKASINSFGQINQQYTKDASISFTCHVNATVNQVMAEVSRDDRSRDMDWCIDHWKEGVDKAKAIQSQQHLREATEVYTAMRAAWPGETRIKELREYMTR